ncbi:MAG TPA: hypothetical protein DCZ01_08015 [Elusimicrobia bacterium]|nr:MAG: hypothetical protein A2X37_11200 [Elusimicrobia bacterium GWA2_66_18]OGR70939.1 MAG: hypothetical protein A2X40_07325 [Elusimicrobia bacterium GWC2_65_9]HAZ08449.1 hypothetical protein [Elusimicrobiota bacterium]
MSSPLRFALTDLKEKGELPVDSAAPAELFPDALSEGALVGPVAVKGVIRRIDDIAAFEGKAEGRWRFECVRCLAPVETKWVASVEAQAPIDAGPLDLTDEMRQSISLAQPMKTLCRPDCKGLCTACRKNRNLADCGHVGEGPSSSTRPRLTIRPDKN